MNPNLIEIATTRATLRERDECMPCLMRRTAGLTRHQAEMVSGAADRLSWGVVMRPLFIVAVVSTLYCSGPAFAQVGMGTTMPPLSTTSPLGSDPGTPIAGTGIPMGSSLPSAPVVSSLPSSPTGAGGMACSTLGTPPAAMYGSPSSYDGGGVTLNGTVAPATASPAPVTSATHAASGISATSGLSAMSGMTATAGSSGMCGSGSSIVASSSAPTPASSTTPGSRAGIPLDSTEIGNLGVSTWAAVPAPSASTSTTP
jgi:hypothetical protein